MFKDEVKTRATRCAKVSIFFLNWRNPAPFSGDLFISPMLLWWAPPPMTGGFLKHDPPGTALTMPSSSVTKADVTGKKENSSQAHASALPLNVRGLRDKKWQAYIPKGRWGWDCYLQRFQDMYESLLTPRDSSKKQELHLSVVDKRTL